MTAVATPPTEAAASGGAAPTGASTRAHALVFAIMVVVLVGAPLLGVYPVFMMKVMCFALFACAFNLLLGFGGLLSFGHAMFLGGAGYAAAHAAKVWGWTPELAIAFATLCTAALVLMVAGTLLALGMTPSLARAGVATLAASPPAHACE